MIHYTIIGDPRTKKNHQKIVGTGRRCPCCGKPEKQWIQQGAAYRQYAELAARQFHPVPDKPIDYPRELLLFVLHGNKAQGGRAEPRGGAG